MQEQLWLEMKVSPLAVSSGHILLGYVIFVVFL
jgi:hypothetical protein